MSIRVATHSIRIERRDNEAEASQDAWDEGYGDEPAATEYEPIATGVRAVIRIATGSTVGPGDSERIDYILLCDPTDLHYLDRVVDEATEDRYQVEWTAPSPGIAGLASVKAGLSTRKGA